MVHHEILLALVGHSGDMIVDGPNCFRIASGISFLHPSEKVLIEHIVQLGFHYRQLHKFMARHQQFEGQEQTGLYLSALCSGMDEVLDHYRSTILSLEHDVLQDPALCLTHILQRNAKFELVLPVLRSIADGVEVNGLKGGEILDLLAHHAVSGDPFVKQSISRLQYHCHKVLFSQLKAWIMHGVLVDPHREMFIKTTASDNSTAPHLHSNDRDDDSDVATNATAESTMHKEQYELNLAMLPSYISATTAQKILFIGNAVSVLNHPDAPSKATTNLSQQPIMDIFCKEIHHMQNAPHFLGSKFETMIEAVRVGTARELWSLVIAQSNIVQHLHTFKRYFLLSMGELWQRFVEETRQMTWPPPAISAKNDLNAALQRAAVMTFAEQDPNFDRLSLVLVSPSSTQPSNADAAEDIDLNLQLQYTVEWPIFLLITPSVIERYNQLFRLLLSVKRTQLSINSAWVQASASMTRSTASPAIMRILHLRHQMGFFVDNLYYYLQADVIEPQFNQLQQKISKTDEFDHVKQAHELFLAEVSLQCFLKNPLITKALKETLTLCHIYARRMASMNTESLHQQIEQMIKEYQRQQLLLFSILTRQSASASSPFLSQLLLRLDYNGFLSSSLERMAAAHQAQSMISSLAASISSKK